jgi:steroid delta-isomerase-like uncharacterized protein
MSMTNIAVPQWIADYTRAWSDHDADGVTAFMADNVSYTDFALGQTFQGHDGVKGFVDGMAEHLSSDYTFTPGWAVETPGGYSFEWILAGTNDLPNPATGMPATGKAFAIRGVSIGVREDGLMLQNHDYWNLAGFLMQVGLMPAGK